MKGFGGNDFNNKRVSNLSRDEIINKAFQLHSLGNTLEASKYYQLFINEGFKDHRVFSNFGGILKNKGKLKEAEKYIRKAIELKPDYVLAISNLGEILKLFGNLKEAEKYIRKAIAIEPGYAISHYNLGCILRDLGNLKEAEICLRKAIKLKPNFLDAHYNLGGLLSIIGNLEEAGRYILNTIKLNPDFARGYYYLSHLEYTVEKKVWQDNLFSEKFLNNKSRTDQVDILFARANVLHKRKNYNESAKFLKLANDLKLVLKPSKSDLLIAKTKFLQSKSFKTNNDFKEQTKYSQSIFIVGMPRSGSTLIESILSLNRNVTDLGEINILEESFMEWEKGNQKKSLADLYWDKIKNKTKLSITTNKWLFNYQYVGIISSQMPNIKIIHCYRNPLDNILSIYRAHFARGNEYSSSLVDSTKVLLSQEEIMEEYKDRFRSKIYDMNYDYLVSNPDKQIRSLINWLGWKWEDFYLSPHLNPRSISTRSNVEARSPIYSKSVNRWKKYKDMLYPAIKILGKTNKYKDLVAKY